MLSRHFSNILKHVIDCQIVINLNWEASRFDITLDLSADITMQYIFHIYISLYHALETK